MNPAKGIGRPDLLAVGTPHDAGRPVTSELLREINVERRHRQVLASLPTVRIYEDETVGVLDGQELVLGVECKIAGPPEKDKGVPCRLDVLTCRQKIFAASNWSDGRVSRGLRMGYDNEAPKGDDAANQACRKRSLHFAPLNALSVKLKATWQLAVSS